MGTILCDTYYSERELCSLEPRKTGEVKRFFIGHEAHVYPSNLYFK